MSPDSAPKKVQAPDDRSLVEKLQNAVLFESDEQAERRQYNHSLKLAADLILEKRALLNGETFQSADVEKYKGELAALPPDATQAQRENAQLLLKTAEDNKTRRLETLQKRIDERLGNLDFSGDGKEADFLAHAKERGFDI